LRAPGAALLRRLGFLGFARSAWIVFRDGVAGRNRPAQVGGGGRALVAADRKDDHPPHEK
jgi:hypothetical protein